MNKKILIKNSTQKLGFSLLELSMAILVIGILIAGIVVGGQILQSSRIAAAQSLTKSSPIPRISNLIVWYETTMEDSFNEADLDSGIISTWRNLNPTIRGNNATAAGAARPTYTLNAINGLPALRFNGTNVLTFTGDALVNSNYTIFAVAARRSDQSVNMIIGGTSATTDNNLHMGYNGNNFDVAHLGQTTAGADYIGFAVPAYTSPVFQIHSVTFNSGSGKIYRNYNGALPFGTQSANSAQAMTTLAGWEGSAIGRRQTDFFNGDIVEVIIFNKSLNNDERKEVEAYLGKKWGIAVI